MRHGFKKHLLAFLVAGLSASPVFAQDAPLLPEPDPAAVAPEQSAADPAAVVAETPASESTAASVEEEAATAAASSTPGPIKLAPGELNPNDIPSVVFTYWEHTAIKDARRSRGLARPVTDEELMKDLKTGPQDLKVKPPPEERDITLGGLVYVNADDWTIWLNGKRVTPKALPKEAIDLKVYESYIEIKWFDDYTNQIFPIRFRPHQRFNIDTRIFLPG